MSQRIYCKDRWGDRSLVLAVSHDLIAIGEVVGPNAEKYIHLSLESFDELARLAGYVKKGDV